MWVWVWVCVRERETDRETDRETETETETERERESERDEHVFRNVRILCTFFAYVVCFGQGQVAVFCYYSSYLIKKKNRSNINQSIITRLQL